MPVHQKARVASTSCAGLFLDPSWSSHPRTPSNHSTKPDATLKGAKGKVHHREIQAYCSSLVETLEDQLTETLRADGFQSNTTEQVLCRRLTSACRGIRRKPKAAAAEAVPGEAAAGSEQPAAGSAAEL
jgi:hypothetical protein